MPTARHLFHFSALTFNAHAIHLDPDYARARDGHRSLLVHGPLALALMLRLLASSTSLPVSSFFYRNHAPLYVDEELTVCAQEMPSSLSSCRDPQWDLWITGPSGELAVKGTANLAVDELGKHAGG